MIANKHRCWSPDRMLRLRVSGLLLLAAVWPGAGVRAETPPRPAVRLSLHDLGFPGYTLSLMHVGASMATVHALDDSHLLFTYSLRSLVPRLPGDDVNDTDRVVAAEVVEVPSGKVLARTQWHLHDHSSYLWRVGDSAFVVRIGHELSLITPMQALAVGEDPFRRYALPHRPGHPVVVAGSPDGKIITVQVESDLPSAGDDGDPEHKKKHYTLEFFRVSAGGAGKAPLQISGAGAVGSPVLLHLPVDGDGYLWAEDGERGKWMVSFNEFGGKEQTLAPVLSSCHPRLNLLSRGEFLAETCRGSDEEPMLASYGFDGHENWEEPFGETLQAPKLALAPRAGRFAMSRLVASSTGTPDSNLANDDPISQEIRVYQTESGDMLLHIPCAPAVRTAENFDLSPDGQMLVVLAPETLDMYRLPELSAKDRKDLAEVQMMTPPVGSGPVSLQRITRPVASQEATSGELEQPNTSPSPAPAPVASASVTEGSVSAAASPSPVAAKASVAVAPAGDTGVSAPRRPPTLLNPGETPEYKGQSEAPR